MLAHPAFATTLKEDTVVHPFHGTDLVLSQEGGSLSPQRLCQSLHPAPRPSHLTFRLGENCSVISFQTPSFTISNNYVWIRQQFPLCYH